MIETLIFDREKIKNIWTPMMQKGNIPSTWADLIKDGWVFRGMNKGNVIMSRAGFINEFREVVK